MAENEEKRVLCEDCGQRNAVCTVAVMMGTKAVHRKLCQACMAKASMSIASGNLGGVLGAILAATRNAVQPAQSPQPQQAEPEMLPEIAGEAESCPQCGMMYQAYRETGCLGCAECARAFRQTLQAALHKKGAGKSHTGRKPLASREAIENRARQVTLQRQLDEAIAREDYAEAARLRDVLRMLNMQEGHNDA